MSSRKLCARLADTRSHTWRSERGRYHEDFGVAFRQAIGTKAGRPIMWDALLISVFAVALTIGGVWHSLATGRLILQGARHITRASHPAMFWSGIARYRGHLPLVLCGPLLHDSCYIPLNPASAASLTRADQSVRSPWRRCWYIFGSGLPFPSLRAVRLVPSRLTSHLIRLLIP
jgi:hypothetical protein